MADKIGVVVKVTYEELFEFFKSRGKFPKGAKLKSVYVEPCYDIVKFQFQADITWEKAKEYRSPPFFQIPEGHGWPEVQMELVD